VSDSPPWDVGPWELRADLEKVQQQWTPVHEILGDAKLHELRAADVSAWSCGEQAGHILLVAQAMARAIEGNLDDPDRDRDGEWTEYTRPVFESGGFPRGRATAPLALDPGGRTRDDFIEMLPRVVSAWDAITARVEEVRACPARARHFVFGYLTSAEWVRICAIHTAHHLAIVRDVRGV
jgi:hypothetical protein